MADIEVHYSGSESFKYVDKLLKNNDRELLIIAPYISDYYAKVLSSKRSKKIRIITSESAVASGTLLASIHKKSRLSYAKALAYLAVLAGIFFYIGILYAAMLAVALIAAAVMLFLAKYRKIANANIEIKATGKQLIHEKMYIGEETAIVGSANLTFSGMHRNIEHIEIIRDRHEIAKLRAHFEELWKTY